MTTKILFMGHKQTSVSLLEFLSTQADIETVGALIGSHLQGSPTTAVAKKLGLPLCAFDTALETAKEGRLKYDLGLPVLCQRKLHDELPIIPCLGAINFYPALLPEYKSTGGYNLAITGELPEWGSTAHYVGASIDTDEVTEVDHLPIDSSAKTAQSLERKTMQVLEPSAQHTITRVVGAQAKLPTMPNISGRCASRDEMEATKWIRSDGDVGKKTRAFWFPPYNGAYVETDGQKYTLINRQLLEEAAPKDSTSLFAGKANT